MTASDELVQKLDRAKSLLSHADPSGNLAMIVERGVDLLLADLEKTRLGKTVRAGLPLVFCSCRQFISRASRSPA